MEYKLNNLKITKYHWFSGDISDGTPIFTSMELRSEMFNDNWNVYLKHSYYLETCEEKTIEKKDALVKKDEILDKLNCIDLTNLKNNYFSEDRIERYSHWELEYNEYFKISGTFDNMPDEVKQIVEILDFENIIKDMIEEVNAIVKPLQEKKKLFYSLAETTYKKIGQLPANSEFTINQFLKDYELESKDKFELCKQIVDYCLVNNVKIKEKNPEADLGLPWNIPRIKLN